MHRLADFALALTASALAASAQVVPNAGPDLTIALPQSASLAGALQNRSPLVWWTADGNVATENRILMYDEAKGLEASPLLRTAGGLTFGWPSDLIVTHGQVYGIESFHRYLYTVNVRTGLCTPIGAQNSWTDVYCLAYDEPGDRLFGVDLAKKQLLRFDRTTGAVSKIGVGTLKGYAMIRGLAYRESDGKLYAADEWTGKILRVDPVTGAPSEALQLPSDPFSRIEELAFHGDELYASLGLQDAGGTLIAGRLQRVDLATGAVANIGPVIDQCSPHALVIGSIPEDFAWSQVSGPATAVIANANSLATSASFPMPGTYRFALTAFTLSGPVIDTVDVTVQ
jgi:hypothetical protein